MADNALFALEDLVRLPRLKVDDAITVIAELEAVIQALQAEFDAILARGTASSRKKQAAADPGAEKTTDAPTHPWPINIQLSVERMLVARDNLLQVIHDRSAQTISSPKERKRADVRVDRAWSALEMFMRSAIRLEDAEQPPASDLQIVYDRILPKPEGLRFLQDEYPTEWSKSEQRLKLIDNEKLATPIEAFGGARHLRNLRAAHKNYGEVLGITAEAVPTPAPIVIRPLHDAALLAIKELILRVRSNADPEIPGSQDLADRIIRPFVAWFERSARGPASPAPTAGNGQTGTATDPPTGGSATTDPQAGTGASTNAPTASVKSDGGNGNGGAKAAATAPSSGVKATAEHPAPAAGANDNAHETTPAAGKPASPNS